MLSTLVFPARNFAKKSTTIKIQPQIQTQTIRCQIPCSRFHENANSEEQNLNQKEQQTKSASTKSKTTGKQRTKKSHVVEKVVKVKEGKQNIEAPATLKTASEAVINPTATSTSTATATPTSTPTDPQNLHKKIDLNVDLRNLLNDAAKKDQKVADPNAPIPLPDVKQILRRFPEYEAMYVPSSKLQTMMKPKYLTVTPVLQAMLPWVMKQPLESRVVLLQHIILRTQYSPQMELSTLQSRLMTLGKELGLKQEVEEEETEGEKEEEEEGQNRL
eukprot:TRINITY_DN2388_c0_g1_i2.p1 TRINITY_DN2388_c0_g1~~TRINITY_DN2388_c0_g1_i2.p1  ORF type:complete len:303 (-),score=110.42 TRINITY_DN2388_c0_g1_i2:621-1442(-)